MKRKLIPPSPIDRIAAALIPVVSALLIFALVTGDRMGVLTLTAADVIGVMIAYVFQDQPEPVGESSEYSEVIGRVERIASELSDLSQFLERERARIASTEQTIQQLATERNKLEPLVKTQRETVEAILTAHSERLNRNTWKERLVGFGLGVIASLIASFAYASFQH